MIDKKLVDHIAKLSRLHLDEEDAKKYQEQLTKILNYIDQLNKLDVSNVKPFIHPGDAKCMFREDTQRESVTREEATKNSPEKLADFFSVPKVIEE